MATTHILVNDFVGLPIIISDFDALPNSNNNASSQPAQSPTPTPNSQSSTAAAAISQAHPDNTVSAMQQNRTTGFSDFADEMWAKMTRGMKQKLREACVEVLRKTEEEEAAEGSRAECVSSWQYDDDARFLD